MLLVSIAVGVSLMLMRGRVSIDNVDCMPPLGYTGGGYRCHAMGHSHGSLGLAIIVLGVIVSLALWGRSLRQASERPS